MAVIVNLSFIVVWPEMVTPPFDTTKPTDTFNEPVMVLLPIIAAPPLPVCKFATVRVPFIDELPFTYNGYNEDA